MNVGLLARCPKTFVTLLDEIVSKLKTDTADMEFVEEVVNFVQIDLFKIIATKIFAENCSSVSMAFSSFIRNIEKLCEGM